MEFEVGAFYWVLDNEIYQSVKAALDAVGNDFFQGPDGRWYCLDSLYNDEEDILLENEIFPTLFEYIKSTENVGG